jgi:hypothetical protein
MAVGAKCGAKSLVTGYKVPKGIFQSGPIEGTGKAKGYRLVVGTVGIVATEAAGDPDFLLGFDRWQYPNDLGSGERVKFYR